MWKCFICGKVEHHKLECRETGGESDKEDFDLIFYDVSNDSEQSNMKVKFKKMPEVILDEGQLCTTDGYQYHMFNKNSWRYRCILLHYI